MRYQTPSRSLSFPVQRHFAAGGLDEDSVIFLADFDTANPMNNWTSEDLTNPGYTWHVGAYNAYQDSSWWCGKTSLMGYDNNWLQFLITPEINLTGAIDPVLACSLYWDVEEPSAFQDYDGWDGCNVWISVTGGNTWQPLTPIYPSYTCNSLYSFGWRWGMGPNVPGWTGFSGGWTSALFDLSNFSVSNVRFRFAFASDAATCTANDPLLTGFFVDNVVVRDAFTTYLSNFGSSTGYPNPMTLAKGDSSGNFWVLSNDQWHSPFHSYNCDDRHFLSDALVSPAISIPLGMTTRMSYWVHCLMPDADGDNDGFKDDFYHIEIAPTGSAIWTELVYDWAQNGSLQQWVERTNGYHDGLLLPTIDLTSWGGDSVKLRFRVETDGNDDGGQGSGLYVDDVTLIATPRPLHDVSAERLMIPFPTYAGLSSITGSVDLINLGSESEPIVSAYWSLNGAPTPLIPWSSINSGVTVSRSFIWNFPQSGNYDVRVYTNLTGDENPENDTAYAGLIEVTPAGIFELGYDHRQITYLPDYYYFPFDSGAGPLVRFTPAADGLTGNLYGSAVKAMFDTTGTVILHILATGTTSSPGPEVYNRSVTIDENHIYPNWADIDMADVSYLQGNHPDFWVWMEVASNDYGPRITGHLQDAFIPDHFFEYNGQQVIPTQVNYNVRAVLTAVQGVEDRLSLTPVTLNLLPNFPNPFNTTTVIRFSLPHPQPVRLDIYDLLGRPVQLLHEGKLSTGWHEITWEATDQASGNYWVRLQVGDQVRLQRIVLLK